MGFIQPVGALRIQVDVIVLEHHCFGNGGIQSTVRPDDGNKQSAEIYKNGNRNEDIKPFEIDSGGLFVHEVKVISNNEF